MPAFTCCFSHSSFVMGTIRRAFLSSSTDVCGVTAAFFVSSLAFCFSFFFSFFFWRFFCFFSFFFLRLFFSLSESELLLELELLEDEDDEEERDLFFLLVFLVELSETLRFLSALFALDSDLDLEWSKWI